MKKIFYLFLIATLSTVSFSSCSDDDDDDKLVTPQGVVTNLSFIDEDVALDKIAGTLTWTLPTSEENITKYVIYSGASNTEKGTVLGEVAKGTTSFEVPEGTPYNKFLLVVAKNESVESEYAASVAVDPFKQSGLYILNGGNSDANNSTLSFYDFSSGTVTGDIYKTANGSGLGDSGEQILIYGSKIYITVTASNRLVVLDMHHKQIKAIEPKNGNEPMRPRCMAASNGKVYVTYYYGHSVAVLDTASLEVENTVAVGRYPEQLTVTGGKIYVANSGGLDYPNYGTTVSVINESSFNVEKEIEVLINPVSITSDSEGDVYVISMGNYSQEFPNTMQRIDGKSHAVSVIGKATRMYMTNDKIYSIYAQWGDSDITFKVYDTLTENIVNNNFITDGTSISSPNAVAVHPATGEIYVTEYDYVNTSSLRIFSADGKLQKTIDTEGYDAKYMAFYIN